MKNNNKFLILIGFLKQFDFSSEDVTEYVSFCETLGIDLNEDFDKAKGTLFDILQEIELVNVQTKKKAKERAATEFQLLKVKEAAQRLSISEPKLRQLIKENKIKTVNVTGGERGTRISFEEIRRFAA